MDLNVLKIQKWLNKPDSLPLHERAIDLEEGEDPAVLVLDADLAREILKHPNVAPFNLWGLYQALTRLTASDLPQLDAYFSHGPLLQNAETHRATRKALVPLYRQLEGSIDSWVETLARDVFDLHKAGYRDGANPAYELAANFTDHFFAKLFSINLGRPIEEIPVMPGRVFDLLPRSRNLLAREQELATLVSFIEESISAQPETDLTAERRLTNLLTLVLMGHDALKGALFFSLSKGLCPKSETGTDWTRVTDSWYKDVSPVGVLPRVIESPFQIDSFSFTKGQVVYICPHILHHIAEREGRKRQPASLAFGAGAHVCPGRGLALKAAEYFFRCLAEEDIRAEEFLETRWRRDLLLIERTTP